MLADRCRVADSLVSRGVGLLLSRPLVPGEGLRITRTSSITMIFMRFSIDAVFLDRERRVVKVAERLRPWTLARGARRAAEVLELPAGTVARTGTQAGDELSFG